MDDETRAGFDEMRRGFDEMRRGFAEMTQRFETVDRRFETVDQRFEAVDQRFNAVDQRFDAVDQRFETLEERFMRQIRELGVVSEDLRAQIRLVAEGVIVNGQALERLRAEINERFRENEIIVGGAFRQIRHDINRLRA